MRVLRGAWGACLCVFIVGCTGFKSYVEQGGSVVAARATPNFPEPLKPEAPAPPGAVPSATPAPVAVAASTPSSAPSPWVAASPQPTAFALVIGIESYGAGLPSPSGARSDAERFAELAKKSLGVATERVELVTDEHATKKGIESALEHARSATPPGGRIYFFFSGLGAPDSGGATYLVPTEGTANSLPATGLSVKAVLATLGESKAREVLAFVDASFSGVGDRSALPAGARPPARLKDDTAPSQIAVFRASAGTESSGSAPGGGLLTKYVLDALGTGSADLDGDGQITLEELASWVKPRVSRDAKKENRAQNPSLTVGSALGAPSKFIVEWGLPSK